MAQIVGAASVFSFSPLVMLTLLVVLGASCGMFWLLALRATTHREQVELSEWARESGFGVNESEWIAPPTIAGLPGPDGASIRIRSCFSRVETAVVQFQTAPLTHIGPPIVAASVNPPLNAGTNDVWQVILCRGEIDWRPTGLRPAGSSFSLLDQFSLTSFPRLGDTERFITCGCDFESARALSESFAVALLPPDVGLLLDGRDIVLDFSGRPFDVIEFNRMLPLLKQIAAHLPGAD